MGGLGLACYGLDYALTFDEIPPLKDLLVKLQGIDLGKRKRLNLACKRFQRAWRKRF
jgi:hypothetical protein